MKNDTQIQEYELPKELKRKTFKIDKHLYLRVSKNQKIFDTKFFKNGKSYFKVLGLFDKDSFTIAHAKRERDRYLANLGYAIVKPKSKKGISLEYKPQPSKKTLKKRGWKIDKSICKLEFKQKLYEIRLSEKIVVSVRIKIKTFYLKYYKNNIAIKKRLGVFCDEFLYKDALKKAEEIEQKLKG